MDKFDELYESISKCGAQIDTAMELAELNARLLGVDVYDLRQSDGTYVMNSLISARIELRNKQREVELLDAFRKAG